MDVVHLLPEVILSRLGKLGYFAYCTEANTLRQGKWIEKKVYLAKEPDKSPEMDLNEMK